MKKYYIGFAVLMAVVLAVFVYAITQASAAKADHATNAALETINGKLDTYTASNSVPASLAAAGAVVVPRSITYTKVSDSEYKLCITYKAASSGFDAGWTGILYSGDSSSVVGSGSSDNSYFDSSVETNHKKGQNCQTIKPYSYNYDDSSNSSYDYSNPSSDSSSDSAFSSSECSNNDNSSYEIHGSAKVSLINMPDAGTGVISFDETGQTIADTSSNPSSLPITNKEFDNLTIFCTADGQSTDWTTVKTGQKVEFYMSTRDSLYVDKIQL